MTLTHLVQFQFLGGATATTGPIPPPVIVTQPSGGYVDPPRKRRTKEELRAERIRLGILSEPQAVEAVQQVAAAVIEASKTPQMALQAQEQAAMLERMFKERNVAVEAQARARVVLKLVIAEEVERQRQEYEDWQIIKLLEGM